MRDNSWEAFFQTTDSRKHGIRLQKGQIAVGTHDFVEISIRFIPAVTTAIGQSYRRNTRMGGHGRKQAIYSNHAGCLLHRCNQDARIPRRYGNINLGSQGSCIPVIHIQGHKTALTIKPGNKTFP